MMEAVKTNWEYFCDESYYEMWAVRDINDRSFHSQRLFHVPSMEEAMALCELLNEHVK